jgi:large subunit ribosomal protein L20
MPRVKRGTIHTKRRRGLLKDTKGYKWGRKSKVKAATTARLKAGQHSFMDRKKKKRVNRALWQVRIGAAARDLGISYSKFIGLIHKAGITVDRKIMAELAAKHPAIFKKLLEEVKQ